MIRKFWIAGALSLALVSTSGWATSMEPTPMMRATTSLKRTHRLPPTFSQKVSTRPRIGGTDFSKRLNELTRKKVQDWKKLVLESGEYDHLKGEKLERALRDPAGFLGVPHLLEIGEVSAVYQNEELVGYVIEVADHVQAAIYQDGAWITFYLEADLTVIDEEAGSA